MTPFLKNLIGAVTLATGLSAALYWVGRAAPRDLRGVPGDSIEDAPDPAGAAPLPLRVPTSPRDLIPDNAWVIVDFSAALLDARPFEGVPDAECRDIAPPKEAALGILPPQGEGDEPHLALAATSVAPLFFDCARRQVLRAKGEEAPIAPGVSFLQGPTGVLLHLAQSASLIFVSGRPDLKALARQVILAPQDRAAGPSAHQALLGGAGRRALSLARATLVLPQGWLDAAGPEAKASPLVALRAGRAELSVAGTLEAELVCIASGCGGLRPFLERAVADLKSREGLGGIEAQWVEKPGQIQVTLRNVPGFGALTRGAFPGSGTWP